jgi:hypothetical protein
MPKSNTVIYNLTVANPSAGGVANLNLIIQHRWNQNISDQTSTPLQLTVNAPASSASSSITPTTITNMKLLLSWGLDPGNLGAIQKKIFRIQATPQYSEAYQAMKVVWSTSAALPATNYTVQVGVCSLSSNCDVLENSVINNLGVTTCSYVAGASGTPNNAIMCTNVPSVSTTGNYVGFRAWVNVAGSIYDSSPNVNDAQFAAVTIFSVALVSGSWVSTTVITATQPSSPYLFAYRDSTLYANGVASPTIRPLFYNLNGNGPLVGISDSNTW